MKTPVPDAHKSKDSNKVPAAVQAKPQQNRALSFTDHRPEGAMQLKLQHLANNSMQTMQLRSFQHMANKAAVQLYKGAEGSNQAGQIVPLTFTAEFTQKHIGNNAGEAIAQTQARINDPNDEGGKMMKDGKIGNTVATSAVWVAAINLLEEEVPDYEVDIDDDGHVQKSLYMDIKGWNVKLQSGGLVVDNETMKRKVSGTYSVRNRNVTVEINHCTQ